jgi:RNA polymerase sigma-70 factor (ECF subfamily)
MTWESDPETRLGGWADALLTAANLLNGADVDALYASLVPSVDAKQRVRDLALEVARKHLANFSEPPPHVLMALGAEANGASETIDNDGADTVNQPIEDSSVVVNCHEFSHFFAVAARIMRRRLIEHPSADLIPGGLQLERAIAVDNLLDELHASQPVWCSIVELKFFVGLTDEETAEVLSLPLRTTRRQFRDARRWLFERLEFGRFETKPDSFQDNSHTVPDGAATIGLQRDQNEVYVPATFLPVWAVSQSVSDRWWVAGGSAAVQGKSSCFDAPYISALQEGDSAAQEHLLAYFRAPVRFNAKKHLQATNLVEDASQETFLRVLRYFRTGNSLERPERLPAFVHSVCKNVVMELNSAQARYAQIPEVEEDPEDVRVNLDRDLVTEERRRIVLEILLQLPENDRELLRLAVFEDTDRDELCRRWGVSRQYLRVLIHRASARLRAALPKEQNAAQRKAGLARAGLLPLTSRRGAARTGSRAAGF